MKAEALDWMDGMEIIEGLGWIAGAVRFCSESIIAFAIGLTCAVLLVENGTEILR